MSNEQKLREALQAFEKAGTGFDICPTRRLPQSEDARRVDEWWLRYFMEADLAVRVRTRQALATTEPVMENGLTEAETDASASVVGLTQRVDWFPELEPIGEIVGTRGTPINTPEFWGYFTEGFKTDLKLRVVTIEQAKAYGEQCWKAGYDLGKSRSE